jgi:uncharacterized alpha-E superfamily protein
MLGRRLERVHFLATLLADRLAPGTPLRQGELEWLLDLGGVSITYRTRYLSTPQLAPALRLLVFDQGSPRALYFQWRAIQEALLDLANSIGAPTEELVEEPMAQLMAATLAAIDEEGELGAARRQGFSAALGELAIAAGRVSDRLVSRHFSLVDLDLHAMAT